eukprot:1177372-Prorocentrum_minimum.AAC.3
MLFSISAGGQHAVLLFGGPQLGGVPEAHPAGEGLPLDGGGRHEDERLQRLATLGHHLRRAGAPPP